MCRWPGACRGLLTGLGMPTKAGQGQFNNALGFKGFLGCVMDLKQNQNHGSPLRARHLWHPPSISCPLWHMHATTDCIVFALGLFFPGRSPLQQLMQGKNISMPEAAWRMLPRLIGCPEGLSALDSAILRPLGHKLMPDTQHPGDDSRKLL